MKQNILLNVMPEPMSFINKIPGMQKKIRSLNE